MNALDLIFNHYEDFLVFSELLQPYKSALNEKEIELRKSLTKKQLSAFDDLDFIRSECYELSQKDAFKCGMRVGAQLIIDLMDKDATTIKKLYDEKLNCSKKTQE